jgi:hypothetical protein
MRFFPKMAPLFTSGYREPISLSFRPVTAHLSVIHKVELPELEGVSYLQYHRAENIKTIRKTTYVR